MARIGATKIYAELAAKGMTATQIAEQAGVHYTSVINWARRYGVTLQKGYGRDPRIIERNKKMANMYAQGCTLESIGKQFGLTRERVRQILKKNGVTAKDGGASLRSSVSAEHKETIAAAKRDARSLEEYGLPYQEMRKHRESGAVAAFRRQRVNAVRRGIEWKMTFAQWWAVWDASGQFPNRGRGIGKYVMARIRDGGCYEMGNVHIITAVENSREAVDKWLGKTKKNPGIFLTQAGTKTPWLAKYGKRYIGLFETEEDAVIAREQFLRENRPIVRKTKGYGVDLRGTNVRYQVTLNGRHIGMFATPREAVHARNKFIKEHNLPLPILDLPAASEPMTVDQYRAKKDSAHA